MKNKIRPEIVPLHFRVIFPKFLYKGKIEFFPPNSKYISIRNNNIPDEFNNNFEFDLELIINKNIFEINATKESLRNEILTFGIILNNQKSEIKINLEKAHNCIEENGYNYKYTKYFRLEKYENKGKWSEIKIGNQNKDLIVKKNLLHISIFGTEPSIPDIKYKEFNQNKEMVFKVNYKQNVILKFTPISIILDFGIGFDYSKNYEVLCHYENEKDIPILGYCNNKKKLWYPAFYYYDKYFENLDNKIKEKKHNINYIKLAEEIKINYELKFSKSELKGNYSLFAYILSKLCLKWFEYDKNIILQRLLLEIRDFFEDKKIIDKINEKYNILVKNNNNADKICIEIIIMFYYIFKERYEIINSVTKEELIKKSDDLLQKYFSLHKSKILDDVDIYNSFKNINKEIEDSEKLNIKLPEKQVKSIIIKEDNTCVFSDKFDTDYSLSKSKDLNENEEELNVINFKTGLINDISFPNEWSIFSLKEFYMKCIKITRELPLYAVSAKKEKNTEMLRKTEELYSKLLELYKNTPDNDESFLQEFVLDFNEQFRKMTSNLINSNVKFDAGILPKKFKSEKKNKKKLNEQYIIEPKISIKNYIPEKQWLEEFDDTTHDIKKDFEQSLLIPYISEASLQIVDQKNELHIKQKEEEKKKNMEKTNQKKLVKKEEKKFEEKKEEQIGEKFDEDDDKIKIQRNDKLISSYRIKFKKSRRASKNDVFEVNNPADKNNNDQFLEVNIDTSIKKEVLQIDVSGMNFKESLLLGLIIQRMKEIDEKIKNKKPLPNLGFKKNLKGQPDYRNEQPSSDIFNVNELYQSGVILANNLVKYISEKNIPFSQMSVNLLIDCSGFINIENKLKQFTILCGIVNALNVVNINYAISVVAESQFACTLKPFDVDHSFIYLQKVLDCLFIKRFIGKNINWISYAMNKTGASSLYRTILVFSNGMDEDFNLIDEWQEKIFNNPNYSFGFFFINSVEMCNHFTDQLDYLKVKWDEFQNKISEKGTNIQLYYYNSYFENYKDLYNNIAERVAILLERDNNEKNNEADYNPPIFNINFEKNLIPISLFENALKMNFDENKEIFIKKTNVLKNISFKIQNLDINLYKNNLSKIAKYSNIEENNKNEIHSFTKKILGNRAKLNKSKIETIFRPNKPSQKVLSTTGTEIDIPALILNLLNPSNEPMIYLEEKGGMVRNYSVTLIIDTSFSCFNQLCNSFSIQTLILMLSTFNSIDLPCFDIILSRQKNPEVLCSNISSVRALNSKSLLWESLFYKLSSPCLKSDLASAIETAFDIKRMRSFQYTSYLFVLTDGLYQEKEYKRIIRAVSNCVKGGLNIFAIGIGTYPIRIEYLFPQVIYCPNPYNLNKAIASFFGDSISGVKSKMSFLEYEEKDHSLILNNKITKIINDSYKLNFHNIYNELKNVIAETDAFLLISNPEDDMVDIGEDIKSNNQGKDLLKENQLKGMKILIVMLWSKNLNPDENECVHKDYLTKVSPQSKACLKDALDYLGVTMDIVENYRDAINKLTSKDKDGNCPYYACWVINGPPYDELPDGSTEGFLLGQFLEVLKLFWEAEGALVFLAEGWKLQYQTNEFLKMLEFDGKKVEFYLVGDDEEKGTKQHKGGKFLEGDFTGKLESIQKFNKKIEIFHGYERLKLDHNLFKLFEGDTICYASTDDPKKLWPFHPFSRDSENGISSLFYSDIKDKGDIFIDCGFTKLFINMDKTDTAFRYFRNIASWSSRADIHLIHQQINANEWRVKGINYKIDINKKWTKFKESPFTTVFKLKRYKTLFAIDTSWSINTIASLYFGEVKDIIAKYYKEGDKFFLWNRYHAEKTKKEIDNWINSRTGDGSTDSTNIVEIAKKCPEHREHLVIVTDGNVDKVIINRSDELMKQNNIKFKYVSIFIIGDEGNLSVGAPFCRDCPNKTIQILDKNHRIDGPSLTLEEIEAYNNILKLNTKEEFESKYDQLCSIIKAKQLGKDKDEEMTNLLIKLKSLIINNLNQEEKDDFEKKWEVLYDMAKNGINNFDIGTAGIKSKK